ncbi:MAG TPA: AAA family ATPase, partial [Pseudoxanthomonas sp.]
MSPDHLLQTNPRSTPPIPSAFHPVRVIAITGGKGGVGKTNVSVNLAISLAEMGKRTLLMDADLGLANVDV